MVRRRGKRGKKSRSKRSGASYTRYRRELIEDESLAGEYRQVILGHGQGGGGSYEPLALVKRFQPVVPFQTPRFMTESQSQKKIAEPLITIGGIFSVNQRLGGGNFGQIYRGTNLQNQETVVVKMENMYERKLYLPLEFKMYQIMGRTEGIPRVFYFGKSTDGRRHGIVMELMGPSLEKLFDLLGGQFKIKTVLQIAVQVMTRLEYIHNHRVIYRDIKPENFLIGRPGSLDENVIHLIDFGLAKEYISENGHHIKFTDGKMLTGTARYMSINTHDGKEQSRRDDLEATGYMLVFFAKGSLPWQGMHGRDAMDKFRNIGYKKKYTTCAELCRDLPIQFAQYMDYVKRLGFEEKPNYELLRDIFRTAFIEGGYTDDGRFDWTEIVRIQGEKLVDKVDDMI